MAKASTLQPAKNTTFHVKQHLQLAVLQGEGVSLAEVSGLHTFFEPAHTLSGGAVGEGFLYGIALGLFLEVVVTNDGGAADGLLKVSVFYGSEHGILIMGPDAGVEIGLELYTDAHAVGVCL